MGLANSIDTSGLIVGRAYFIIKEFIIKLIEDKVRAIVSQYLAETWEEIALLLRPYFYWEYEKE